MTHLNDTPDAPDTSFEDWYEHQFGPNGTPTFSDYVKAHLIGATPSIDTSELMRQGRNARLLPIDEGRRCVGFYLDRIKVKKRVNVWGLASFLFDSPEPDTEAAAVAYTFILEVPGGMESDVFAAIDCDWEDVGNALFPLLHLYPETTCRLMALGHVGYTTLTSTSHTSPGLKLLLNQALTETILPSLDLMPYVMLYDTVAPGYRADFEIMIEDANRLPLADHQKALALITIRSDDEDNHLGWMRQHLNCSPLANLSLAMTVLSDDTYTEEILFTFNFEQECFAPAIEESRESPLNYEDYLGGRYKPYQPK